MRKTSKMKWKTLKGLLGTVSVAALGIVSPHKTDAQTTTFPIDFTINFKNYINVKNGLAGLDANGNITASLLNNARVGGSDTGTDISAAQVTGGSSFGPQMAPTNSLNTLFSTVTRRDPDIWLSGSENFTQVTPDTTRFIRATGRMSLSIANTTIQKMDVSDLQPILDTFADTPNSIGLIKDTKWLPDQPDYRYPLTSVGPHMGAALGNALAPGKQEIDLNGAVIARDDGNGHLVAVNGNGQGTVDYTTGIVLYQFSTPTTATDKIWVGFSLADGYGSHAINPTWWTVMDQSPDGDDSPEKIQQLGYKPVVMLINENGCDNTNGNTELWCDMTLSDLKNALPDVQKIAPSIKYIFPYISPNAGVFGNFDTDKYWANAKLGALQQGGFAIDMPAEFFLDNSEEYRQFVVQLIQWAHANNVIVICELTPGGTDNTGRNALKDEMNVISYLKDNNAVPNVWYDDQYGRAVSPGTDDLRSPNYTTDSTLAVARWLADTVGTTDLPDDKIGYMGYGSLIVPTPNANAFGATRETLGEMFSELGSMAFQPQNNVHITGGDLNNMWAMNMTSGAHFRFGSDGTTPVDIIGNGEGTITVGGNIDILGGNGIILSGAGGSGAGESVIRGQSTDRFMHIYNPFTTDSEYTGISFDNNAGVSQAALHLDTSGNLIVDTASTIKIKMDELLSATLQFAGAGGTGSGIPVLRARQTDHFLHLYNPYTTDMTQVGLTFDDSTGETHNSLVLNSDGTLTFSNNINVGYGGSFTDPDSGVTRDAKFGNKGIAVSGGIKTDTITVTGPLSITSIVPSALAYATLPSSPQVGQVVYCADCYSKLREEDDTSTGIVVMWNGSRWNDALGIAAQH